MIGHTLRHEGLLRYNLEVIVGKRKIGVFFPNNENILVMGLSDKWREKVPSGGESLRQSSIRTVYSMMMRFVWFHKKL